MSIPVIILGAGASFDYIREDLLNSSLHKFRPPLTDNLFRPHLLDEFVTNHSALDNLASSAESAMQHNQSLEDYLTEIRLKNPERQGQIVAMQYYLQYLFQKISENYKQPRNNYKSLIQSIRDTGNDEACVVTFNYDSLFEKALDFPKEIDINNYIKNPIKLIKIHGSCDWVRVLRDEWGDIKEDYGSSYNFLVKNPHHIKDQFTNRNIEIYVRTDYEAIRDFPGRGRRSIFFHPEIMVPLAEKEDSFVCPNRHIDIMKAAIEKADRILIIGWKAGDKSFVKLMKENIKNPIEITIVSGSQKDAHEVYENLKHIGNLTPRFSSSTFSSFMGSPMCKQFFSYK